MQADEQIMRLLSGRDQGARCQGTEGDYPIMSSYYDDFEAPYEIYEKWTKGAKTGMANKKGHDERSYDDPASGDAVDTPRTDALIAHWMQIANSGSAGVHRSVQEA